MLSVLKFLLGRRAQLFPFENEILDALKSRLDAESGAKLQRQIEVINTVQRLAGGKEVNLYRLRHGKPVFADELRFPLAAEEVLLATAYLSAPGKRAKLKADIWLANGRLFSLVFNKPPKQFFTGEDLKSVQPEIADLKIWIDPNAPPVATEAGTVDVSALTGWMREWCFKGQVADLRKPLPEAQRAEHLARIDARLPVDYLDLVAQTEGATLAGFVVSGTARIRQVVSPTANYYILADKEGIGALAVKQGDSNSELYWLPYEQDSVRSVGTSLATAITGLMNLN